MDQIVHDAFTGDAFSSSGISFTHPHKLHLFTSLKMRLGSGRDRFNYIIRGCEIRRWYRWGNSDVATNGGERAVDRHAEYNSRRNSDSSR